MSRFEMVRVRRTGKVSDGPFALVFEPDPAVADRCIVMDKGMVVAEVAKEQLADPTWPSAIWRFEAEPSGIMFMKHVLVALALVMSLSTAHAETPDEWVALGARVHGGFGASRPAGHQDRA